MVLLWLEKVNWTDFFCKNGIPYTNCQWKSKKQDKKRAKTLQKRCIFHPPRPAGSVWTDFDPVKICSNRFWPVKTRSNGFWPGQNLFKQTVWTDFDRSKSVRTDFDRVKICSNGFWPGQNLFERILTRSKSVQTEPASRGGLKKPSILEGFCPLFVLFFAFSRTICTWHGYFSKKLDPACFFWPQGPLIQSSAAPQGSPPPTQQINIRTTNQLSWAIN